MSFWKWNSLATRLKLTRFDTSYYDLDRSLPKGKNLKNWINERFIISYHHLDLKQTY